MFRTVAVGGGHACAVATSGDMYCRGGNNYGQLGNGTMTASQEPTRVLGGINFRAP
jgi:alpha-tubulin suppressor-like RCC1 family protein